MSDLRADQAAADAPLARLTLLVTLLTLVFLYWLSALSGAKPFLTPAFTTLLFVEDRKALHVLLVLSLAFLAWRRIPLAVHRTVERSALWVASHLRTTALAVLALTAAGSVWVYQRHPLSMDEYCAVFQATVFSEGALTGRFPPQWVGVLVPVPAFMPVSYRSGVVATSYWPGFALLLTPFAFCRVPWLLNPCLSALTVWVAGSFTRRLVPDARVTGWAILVLLACPVFWANGISYYAMTAQLLFNLLFAWCLLEESPGRFVLAGLTGSLTALLGNPVPHLLFAVPWVWQIVARRRFNLLGWLALGYLPLSLLIGVGWAVLLQGIRAYAVPEVLTWPGATMFLTRAAGLIKLWAWACPGLLVAAAYGMAGASRGSRARTLGWSLVTTFVGYLFIRFDQGHGWGFRYLHSAFFALPLLAAGYVCSRDSANRLAASVAPMVLTGMLVLTPWHLHAIQRLMTQVLDQVPPAPHPSRSIVWLHAGVGFYTQDLVQNDPFLRNRPLRLYSYNPNLQRSFMATYFPDARVALWNRTATVWELPRDIAPQRQKPASEPR